MLDRESGFQIDPNTQSVYPNFQSQRQLTMPGEHRIPQLPYAVTRNTRSLSIVSF